MQQILQIVAEWSEWRGGMRGEGGAPVPHDEEVLEADPGAAVQLLEVVKDKDRRQVRLPVQAQHQLQQPLHPHQPLPGSPGPPAPLSPSLPFPLSVCPILPICWSVCLSCT